MKLTLPLLTALTLLVQCTTQDLTLQEMHDRKMRDASFQSIASQKNSQQNLSIEMIIYEGFEETYEARLGFEGRGNITIAGADEFAGTYSVPVNFQDNYLPGTYTLDVNGKLNQITALKFFSYQGAFKTFTGIEQMKALRELELELHGPTLDLTQNKKLEYFSVGIHDVSNLILPEQHSIRFFFLRTNAITIEQYVAILDNIHSNAMRKSIMNGAFDVSISEEIEQYIAANPEVANKLLELRDVLGWELSYIPA
ncbi:MAG TPA: hypothetical protein VGD40_05340 [Chryseosolibacter sp.]